MEGKGINHIFSTAGVTEVYELPGVGYELLDIGVGTARTSRAFTS